MNIEKRRTLMLLIVSITFAGCYEHPLDPFTGDPLHYKRPEDQPIQPPLRLEITKPVKVSPELKAVQRQNKALLVRISELEIALTSKTEVARIAIEKLQSEQREAKFMLNRTEALLVRISDLEVMLETQRAESKIRFERLENICFVYEVAIEAQGVTIETLQKLCRLYESSAGGN